MGNEPSPRTLARGGALVAAGAVGAAIAVGIVAAVGGIGAASTTVREVLPSSAPQSSPEEASFAHAAHQLTIHQIYMRSAPGVVQVTATSKVTTQPNPFFDPFGVPQTQTTQALGSGFVIDKAGHIVTNYHVVQGASKVEVSFSNNERLPATIVGRDPSTDVAVLDVKAHSRAFTPLLLGNSDAVEVGDSVVAIGNPLGEDRSITSGIVSALQRQIVAPNGAPIDHVIQTDAALNHGNSGGPLLNTFGQVIGVNSQIQTDGSNGNIGIGFAIPINTVKSVAAQLITNGVVEHPFLGVDARAITADIARLFRLPVKSGLLVSSVCPATGASKAGLHGATQQVTVAGETWPLGGDIIVKADGVPVASVEQLRSLIGQKKPGDSLRLEIYRGTKNTTLKVKLGRQPLTSRC
ncbi:MAG TPA: trypsin-like peptidase domain-containing protein [Gaiellaceae bacterium]|nr:trypsin-like peptidase domain-containing protein [Gaiellaceae bacterium]